MRHSLLSRFQGTLFAAALGEELGAYSRSRQARSDSDTDALGQTINLAGWHPGGAFDLSLEGGSSRHPSFGGGVAVSCARVLVKVGSWHDRERAIGELVTHTHNLTARQPWASGSSRGMIAAELAIASLPLSLFFHNDESNQQQCLLQTLKRWYCPLDTEAGVVAVGYAIAQVLQERLAPKHLLPQTIAYLKQSTANPTPPLLELTGTLEQAQLLVEQNAGLHTAIERLWTRSNQTHTGAIALAFYCFLSTPNDLRLSLLRSARCGEVAPVVCSLAGALSGAHQGISGLPLSWQQTDVPLINWGITAGALRQLATHLFASWSGVYASALPMDAVAIAAPGVIRPR